jgi:hypothetical protein
MNHKTIFAFAALIFATGYLIRSINPAKALPNGPHISTGSNPIINVIGSITNGSRQTVLSNTTSDDVIITGVRFSHAHCQLIINGTILSNHNEMYGLLTSTSMFGNSQATLKLTAGADLEITCPNGYNTDYYIQGYYTHH